MHGTVRVHKKDRYGVETDSGDWMAFEMLEGSTLEPGESVDGDLEALGGETLSSSHGKISVFVQFVHSSRPTVERWVIGRAGS
jgi:hypothetical protein